MLTRLTVAALLLQCCSALTVPSHVVPSAPRTSMDRFQPAKSSNLELRGGGSLPVSKEQVLYACSALICFQAGMCLVAPKMHRDITKLPMSDDMLRLFAGPALLGWGLGKYVAAKSGAAAEYCRYHVVPILMTLFFSIQQKQQFYTYVFAPMSLIYLYSAFM
mmetsp:Transcript_23804/g.56874  ORF Transcript_23804/g.56874 Transcript_23804/m.56874 type:complete len:162 (+) Transcript_23804:63-548(+)